MHQSMHIHHGVFVHFYFDQVWLFEVQFSLNNNLKGPKREKLHAMHVKELIKTNYFER